MIKFNAVYQTTTDVLNISASTNEDGFFEAIFKDSTGSWVKEFYNNLDFNSYLKTLRVINKISYSYSN